MCSVGVLLLCTHIQTKWVSECDRDWERSSDTPSQLVLMERDRREKVKATQIWKFKLSVLTMGEVVTVHSWSQYKATLLWESCWRTLVTISCKISSRKKMRLAGFRVLLQMYKPLIMSPALLNGDDVVMDAELLLSFKKNVWKVDCIGTWRVEVPQSSIIFSIQQSTAYVVAKIS